MSHLNSFPSMTDLPIIKLNFKGKPNLKRKLCVFSNVKSNLKIILIRTVF